MMTPLEREQAAIALVERWGEDVEFIDVIAVIEDPDDGDAVYAMTRRVRNYDMFTKQSGGDSQ